MTREQIIQRAIRTEKELRKRSASQCGNTRICMEDGANAIEALVGLLQQKDAAPGDSSTESGKT